MSLTTLTMLLKSVIIDNFITDKSFLMRMGMLHCGILKVSIFDGAPKCFKIEVKHFLLLVKSDYYIAV